MSRKIDLSGQKFGRLTILYEAMPHYTTGGNKKIMWHCMCNCGTEVDVSSGDLLSNRTKSCGCLNKDNAKLSKFKQHCTYEFPENKDYCIGHTSKGDIFVIDIEDYKRVSQYNWFLHHNYFEAHIPMSNPRRVINLHRFVMNVSDEKYDYTKDVDHIKTENKWDNRKCNLRIVTKRQNCFNHGVLNINNSGITGVYFYKRKDRPNDKGHWRVRFNIKKNKQKQFDCKSKEEAIALRKILEKKYHGEFSYDNSQSIAKKYEIKEEINENGTTI